MTPKVSVIIPCYNEPEKIFRRSLESVIQQTLQEIEIIVILDKPDNQELKDIIAEYRKMCENIILLTPENNLGRGNARNLGVSVAQGTYIAIHDADDVDARERLEEQYSFMEENPDIGVVFSRTVFTNEQGETLQGSERTPYPEAGSVFRKQLNHQTMFIRTETMKTMEGYKDLNYGEDMDLWMRLYLAGVKMGKCDGLHSYYLSPFESTHSDYVKKLKKWRISSLKFYIRYFTHLSSDPLFVKYLAGTLSDYIALHFPKKYYLRYRRFVEAQRKKVYSK